MVHEWFIEKLSKSTLVSIPVLNAYLISFDSIPASVFPIVVLRVSPHSIFDNCIVQRSSKARDKTGGWGEVEGEENDKFSFRCSINYIRDGKYRFLVFDADAQGHRPCDTIWPEFECKRPLVWISNKRFQSNHGSRRNVLSPTAATKNQIYCWRRTLKLISNGVWPSLEARAWYKRRAHHSVRFCWCVKRRFYQTRCLCELNIFLSSLEF